MALPTLGVLDKDSAPQTINTLRSGSAAAADSAGVAQSTEDIARAGIITETAPATDTASSGLNGRLQRIAQRLTSLIALFAFGEGSTGATTLRTTLAGATTGTVTQVASSGTNVTLKAANTARVGLTIFNDSTQVLYVKFGATASATSYTVKMAAASYFEVPARYNGIIDGIWASANGNAYVTEIA